MNYIAHKDGDREQSMVEHLSGTAKLAGEFAGKFGMEDWGFRRMKSRSRMRSMPSTERRRTVSCRCCRPRFRNGLLRQIKPF